MSNIAIKRVKREFLDNAKYSGPEDSLISLETVDSDFTKITGKIIGATETPYESGVFMLNIFVPDTYPFNPPKVSFKTPVWHPNISSATGAICLDILRDKWAASLTLRTVLISLQALLSSPVVDDPQDAMVAAQYKRSTSMFESTAQFWTHVFANGPHYDKSHKDMVDTIISLGFTQYQATTYLSYSDWNLELASQRLLDEVKSY